MASTAELSILITGKNEAGKAFKDAEKSVSGFSKALSGVATVASGFVAANVLQGGLQKLTDFASNSIDAFKESQAAAAQLNAVLKSTGGAAGVTADEVTNLASALEKQSLFEDEAIIKGTSMLLTFTNIGKTVMPQATQAIVDMSQAMGQDLQSSAVQVGKALNDPIAGISALSRVGVTFNEQQKEQIRLMVEAGNTAGAQTLILNELSKEFGGSAKAASDAAGASEVQKDRMNELNEVIGQKLLPIQEKWKELQVAAITFLVETAIPAIEQWIEKHPELVAAMEDVANFISENWPTIEAVISEVIDNVSTKVEGFIEVVSSISATVTDVVDTVDALIHGRWAEAWDAFKQIPADVLALMEGMFKEALGNLPDQLYQLGVAAGEKLWQGIKDGIGDVPSKLAALTPGLDLPVVGQLNPLKRAGGGPVSAGRPYIVGERGPELMVPGRSGTVVPNGAGTVHVHVEVAGREIGRAIVDLAASGALRGVI